MEEIIQSINCKLDEKTKELIETENGMEYNYKLYNSACDIGEYIGKKFGYDFNALVNEHMENSKKSVERIVDGKTQQAEWER